MKKHTLTMSLALLSAAFLGGCQEQGSTPVGPEALGPQFHAGHGQCEAHNKKGNPDCDGGDGGGGGPTVANATVVLSVGMVTSSAQDVRIQRENDSEIRFEDVRDETGASTFRSRIALTLTHAAALVDHNVDGKPDFFGCVVDPADTPEVDMLTLLDMFLDGEQLRFFGMNIDKTALSLASDAHGIASTFTDDITGKLISLVGAGTTRSKKLLPGVSATATLTMGGINGDFTVEFSGGAASVRDRTGKVREHVTLACPNKDKITVAVTRLP